MRWEEIEIMVVASIVAFSAMWASADGLKRPTMAAAPTTIVFNLTPSNAFN